MENRIIQSLVMLFIWKGKGWVVPAIFLADFVDVQRIVDYFMGKGFYSDN